jgi:hypothetical protein
LQARRDWHVAPVVLLTAGFEEPPLPRRATNPQDAVSEVGSLDGEQLANP